MKLRLSITTTFSNTLLKYIPWNKYTFRGINIHSSEYNARSLNTMTENKNKLAFKLMKLLEIINQLSTAKVTKALQPFSLSYSQFSLLNHFSNDPEQKVTVSQLANSMQMNQPGITKIVNKLTEMGLVDIRKDSQDARKKWITINKPGLETLSQAQASVMDEISDCFSCWETCELEDMLKHAHKLQTWFDNNR